MSDIDPIKKITDEIKDLEKKISYPLLMEQTKRKAKKKPKDEEIHITRKVGEEIISSTPMGIIKYDLTDDGTGKKYDSGKSMVGTLVRIFAGALLGIGTCITFGQKKYPKSDNWKLVENGEQRYADSLMRHLTKFYSGEEFDPETGLPHLFHCGWNMLAIIEFYLMRKPELLKEIRK